MSQQSAPVDALTITSPIGPITLEAENTQVTAITIGGTARPGSATSKNAAILREASTQLSEYFAGSRTSFDLPLNPRGTVFQREVWRALARVNYGQSVTYAELGRLSGHPRSARAVGGAVGANPLPIVIPCHRVVGADGSLTGYSGGGGLDTKRRLLAIEQGH